MIAQKALNTVMKANPYVLAATVLAGLVATMWAFHDSTTASEKAQQNSMKNKRILRIRKRNARKNRRADTRYPR